MDKMDKMAAKLQKMKLQKDQDEEDEDEEEYDEEERGEPLRPLNKFEEYRVAALRLVDEANDVFIKQYVTERIALEHKYIGLRAPNFEQRAKIIAGTVEVPQVDDASKPSIAVANAPGEKDNGIAQFWLGALAQSGIRHYISEADMGVLESLNDMTVTYSEDYCSFALHFFFAENEYFSNTELTKTYTLNSHVFSDDPALNKVEFSPIDWREGKDVTVREVKKTQKLKSGKNKGQTRTQVKIEPQPSFFRWFAEPMEDDEEEDEEEEEKEMLNFNTEDDYELGHYLRTEVIPNATQYFLGEIDDADDDGDYDEEGEEEEEDEDEDEDEAPKGKKGKSGKAPVVGGFGAPPGTQGLPAPGENPECKQN